MSNYRKKLIVKPGSKIRLKHFDPGDHGKHESHKSALREIQENLQKMEQLQYRMYAENKHSLLIVLQGLDAAGKDGVVRHVLTGMNPPEKIVRQLLLRRLLEVNGNATFRIHAGQNVADYAVLASSIQTLQDNEKRMLVPSIHQVLQLVHFLQVLLNLWRSRLVRLMFAVIAGIEMF